MERCKKSYFETLQRLNVALKNRNLPPVEVDPKQMWFGNTDFDPFSREMVDFNSSTQFSIDFVVVQGREPQIDILHRNIPFAWYIVPPKATWSAARAAQEARFWYEAVIGPLPANIGKPKAEYSDNYNGGKYNDGEWTVDWPRVDAQGHRFEIDHVTCIMDEKNGMSFLSCYLASSYTEGQKVVVKPGDAAASARPQAKRLMQLLFTNPMVLPVIMPGTTGGPGWLDWQGWVDWWNNGSSGGKTSLWSWLKGYSVTQVGAPDLRIVNPNHVLNSKTLTEMPYGDIVARLAWVVTFRVTKPSGVSGLVEIWIDTETGEILGGTDAGN